ncbi:large ribosomal subunit protein mL41A-like [Dysidea avara]|uniref:large ribosomal subunit protein mL41A-like n=1 Tax=Dysidea avara TaxID=196820 RepID=UPI00332CB91D
MSRFLRGALMGARREPMTSKRGNKDFYKGGGAKPTGVPTKKGGYLVLQNRITHIIIPDLTGFKLKPYVSLSSPKVDPQELTGPDLLEMVEDSTEVTETSSQTQT